MFDAVAFDRKVDSLTTSGQVKKAEEWMLQMHSELRSAREIQGLDHVLFRLAHFYCSPGTEDLTRAEMYFLERERISPGAYAKSQTATFYFYILRDLQKTLEKVDEIKYERTERASYYSALCLKGHALIKRGTFEDANKLLGELNNLIETNPSGLPYGDEVNFLEEAGQIPTLLPRCSNLLKLIIPKMRSREYQEKAAALLNDIEGKRD